MKRILLLILVLLLLVDLAEDGCFGPATVDLPVALTKTSITTPHHAGSGQVDLRHEFAPANLWKPSCPANYQPATFRVQPTLKIIDYRNTGSSGAIPSISSLSSPAFSLASTDLLAYKFAVILILV